MIIAVYLYNKTIQYTYELANYPIYYSWLGPLELILAIFEIIIFY